MLIVILILLPLLSGLILLPIKNSRLIKWISALLSVAEFLLSLYMIIRFNPAEGMQFRFSRPWIPMLGINLNFGIDGISLIMLLLTNILVPFIIISGNFFTIRRLNLMYALIFFCQFALVGVFTSMNAIVFYIFWELALVPVFFMMLVWGGENRQFITLKFFIYTLLGSLALLFSFIFLYHQTTLPHSFELQSFMMLHMPARTQVWLFWFMFLAFAIKMPMFPFHSWQPETYTVAPFQGTMLLAGIMLKMGIYGCLRWLLPVIPSGVDYWRWVVIILSLTGMIYAAIIAFDQKNLKTLIAWSSLSHVGMMAAALFAANLLSIQGLLFQVLSHGIIIIGLLYCAWIIGDKTETLNIDELGGIKTRAPVFSGLFLIITLVAVALLPLTNGFVSEFLMISGIYSFNFWMAITAGLKIILSAIYMLYMYQVAILGQVNKITEGFNEINFNQKIFLLMIVGLIIIMGIYPQPVLNLTENAVQDLLSLSIH